MLLAVRVQVAAVGIHLAVQEPLQDREGIVQDLAAAVEHLLFQIQTEIMEIIMAAAEVVAQEMQQHLLSLGDQAQTVLSVSGSLPNDSGYVWRSNDTSTS
jgi:hypothetical protein